MSEVENENVQPPVASRQPRGASRPYPGRSTFELKRRQSGANLPKFKDIYKSYFESKVRKLLLNLPRYRQIQY